jgi:hypothetical protein
LTELTKYVYHDNEIHKITRRAAMLIFRIIGFLWPFLKEMILGDKTLKEALKSHKGRVLLIAGIILSVCINFFAIPRLVDISSKYVLLKREYESLQWDMKEMIKPPPADAVGPAKPAVPVAPVAPPLEIPQPVKPEIKPTPPPNTDRYRKTKETFDRIRAREEKEMESTKNLTHPKPS